LSSTTERTRERGQVLVLFAGGLVALLIVAALAFDVGMMLVERRDQQNAADAAALAGARYVLLNEADAEAAARDLARDNGFDDADANVTVDVHIPAIHGRYAGFPGFIEVQISADRPSIFGGVIGRATWPVGAMAVATNAQNMTFPFSMLALNPTECKAIAVSGGGVVEAFANIQSNSSGSDCTTGGPVGFSRTGGATIEVNAPDATCRVVGEFQDQGSGPPIDCTIAQNSFALPDPLRNLEAPAKPALAAPMVYAGTGTEPAAKPRNCPGSTSHPPNEAMPTLCKLAQNGSYQDLEWILSPGLYPGGLEISGGTTAYLMPGIYWIGGGGIRVATGGSIISIATEADADPDPPMATVGGGVMIYNSKLPAAPGGPITFDGNAATMNLQALDVPAGHPDEIYNDMVLFQDRTVATTITLNGAASSSEVEGIVYAPAAQIKLLGNGGTLILDQVIADTYDIRGDGGTIRVLRNTGVDATITAAGLVD
jgi:Flp pilus assembly protein TadG